MKSITMFSMAVLAMAFSSCSKEEQPTLKEEKEAIKKAVKEEMKSMDEMDKQFEEEANKPIL